jgi:hypothetical protein
VTLGLSSTVICSVSCIWRTLLNLLNSSSPFLSILEALCPVFNFQQLQIHRDVIFPSACSSLFILYTCPDHLSLCDLITLTIFRPLVREGATKLQTPNCLKEISRRKENWSQVPDGRLTPGQTGRLTVGRKLTN